MWQWMKWEMIYVSVASASQPNGSISGLFVSRPHTGVTLLTNSQVIPTAPNATSTGLGIVYAYSAAQLLGQVPADFLLQDASIINTMGIYGRIVHNVVGSTGATWNGPSNTTTNAPALNTFTRYGSTWFLNATTTINNAYLIDAYSTYFSVASTAFPNGEIRGQILPLIGARRRKVPFSVTTASGTTQGNDLATLRAISQVNRKFNPNTIVRCSPDPVVQTYEGIFTFKAGVTKRNIDGVRGFQFEANLRGQGQLYLFEMLNYFNTSWTTLGSFSGATSWTPVFSLVYTFDAANYINSRGMIQVRISSIGSRQLFIDELAIRLYHARALSAQTLRAYTKFLQHLPSH